MDRVTVYETAGCPFESGWAQFITANMIAEFRSHEYYMQQAVSEAKKAYDEDEVPVGAVIVYEGKIIARAHNQREMLLDPTAHAEMIAITQAATHLQNWRLSNTTIYVTLEPCTMCTGALVQGRVKNLVFGAKDEKYGACGSVLGLADNPRFNHQLTILSGVLEDECRALLKQFFLERCRSG